MKKKEEDKPNLKRRKKRITLVINNMKTQKITSSQHEEERRGRPKSIKRRKKRITSQLTTQYNINLMVHNPSRIKTQTISKTRTIHKQHQEEDTEPIQSSKEERRGSPTNFNYSVLIVKQTRIKLATLHTQLSIHTKQNNTKQEIEVGYTGTPLRHSYNNQFHKRRKKKMTLRKEQKHNTSFYRCFTRGKSNNFYSLTRRRGRVNI